MVTTTINKSESLPLYGEIDNPDPLNLTPDEPLISFPIEFRWRWPVHKSCLYSP